MIEYIYSVVYIQINNIYGGEIYREDIYREDINRKNVHGGDINGENIHKRTCIWKIKYTEEYRGRVEAKPRFRSGMRHVVVKTKRDL